LRPDCAAERQRPWQARRRLLSGAFRSKLPFRAVPVRPGCTRVAWHRTSAAPGLLRTDRTDYVTVRMGMPRVL